MTSPTMRPPKLGVSYSEAVARAYATAPEEEIIFETLEFQHPSFESDVRVVNDHSNLTAGLEGTGEMVEFTACFFQFTRPEEGISSSMPEVGIRVDNVAKILLPYIKLALQS